MLLLVGPWFIQHTGNGHTMVNIQNQLSMSVGLLALLSAMLVAIVVGGFVASRGLQGGLAAHISWMQPALFRVLTFVRISSFLD